MLRRTKYNPQGIVLHYFIHVEGPDGVGKSTLCQNIVETINYVMENSGEENGKIRAVYQKFPSTYPDPAVEVSEYYYLNQFKEYVDKVIEDSKHYSETDIMLHVLDRSFMSTAVYQGMDESHMHKILSEGVDIFYPEQYTLEPFESRPAEQDENNPVVMNAHLVVLHNEPERVAKRLMKRKVKDGKSDIIDFMGIKKKIEAIQKLTDKYYEAVSLYSLNIGENPNAMNFMSVYIVDDYTTEDQMTQDGIGIVMDCLTQISLQQD